MADMRLLTFVLATGTITATLATSQGPTLFQGHQVWQVELPDVADALLLRTALPNNGHSTLTAHNPRVLGVMASNHLDIQVPPTAQEWLRDLLAKLGLAFRVTSFDLDGAIKKEKRAIEERAAAYAEQEVRDSLIDVANYHDFEEIMAYIDQLEESYSFVSTEEYGSSYEGRPLRSVKVCKDGCGNKPIFFITSGMHAREWMAEATAIYIIDKLVENPSAVTEILLQDFDWYFVLVGNPDGYVYSWEEDRFWRKTRKPTSVEECPGTDPNRNFDQAWDAEGSVTDPCSENYRGEFPESAEETGKLSDYIQSLKEDIVYYNEFNSYFQAVFYPYKSSLRPSPYAADLQRVAQNACNEVAGQGGANYTISQISTFFGVSGGEHTEYVHVKADVKYSYHHELRPDITNPDGWAADPSLIALSGSDMIDFHRSVAADLAEEYLQRRKN